MCSFGEETQTQNEICTLLMRLYHKLQNMDFSITDKQAVLSGIYGPRTLFNMWQGLPHINKIKQYETLLSFKLSLFIHDNKDSKSI